MGDYRDQLFFQLDFLKRSCERFDQGAQHEAISMSGVLRILFHDTNSMISLLRHLKSEIINMTTTCMGIPVGIYIHQDILD
jgi:hypothetical protein